MWFFWVLVLLVTLKLVLRWLRISAARSKSGPEGILGARLARGEIDKSEYKRRFTHLQGLTKPYGT